MRLSREARVVAGITLVTVPTVMYGGATLLGLLTSGAAGMPPGDVMLNETQWALFRAGHAHAGVWLLFSLVLQVLLDSASLPSRVTWAARLTAPVAAIAVSGGFFGVAFSPAFRWLLYAGAACLAFSAVATGVGLIRRADALSADSRRPRGGHS